jgi:putative ABC transport system permease protein
VIHLIQNVRFALRRFRRAPVPFLAAIVTLALGIGANTAIFSLVDGIWLRPLPIADPSHLVAIESVKNHAAADSERDNTTSSFPEFLDIRERVPAFADVAASDRRGVVMETADGLQILLADVVSDNYFTLMGVRPELGQLPDENQLRKSEVPVIVLSHGTWKRLFAGNPGVIGQTVTIKGGPATVLAVMPAGFRGTERVIDPQVYVPRSTYVMWNTGEWSPPRTSRQFEIYARLRPGATLDQARAQLQGLSAELAAKFPQANRERSFTAGWQAKSAAGPMKMMRLLSMLLLAIAGAVLLIACTNIANLLLALNDSRRRELAMRVALGATRGLLLRQLVTEYILLAVAGVAGALILAERLIALVPALLPDVGFPLGFDFRIDHRVLAFTAAAGVVSVLLCGLAPALATTRTSPLDAMRTQAWPRGSLKMPARKVFVVAQLAVSMALLMATGLLVRTLIHVETMDMGFNSSQNALLMTLAMGKGGPQVQAEFDALAARMRALPGVKDATIARIVPFAGIGSGMTKFVLAPGELPSETAGTPVWFNSVDSEYFRAMGVPLERGRSFQSQDTATSEKVAILNQTMAKRLFGGEDVIGRHLRIGRKQTVDVEIVGVARDGRYNDVTETPQPYLYLPLAQDLQFEPTLIVTTLKEPGALLPAARAVLREVDPYTLVERTETLTDHMRFATYENRVAAWLTASLGALALLLTAVGLYGVTAYLVSRRTHEIGVRMAMGAQRGTVFISVLKDGLKLTLAGILLGMGLALLVGSEMSSLLYGVKPFDPITLLVVAAAVISASIAALIVPARRALRVNPADALREE